MNWIAKILTDLQARKFYGKITIHFENGRIILAKKEATLKPPKG
jgi:hypothetical protein